VTGIGIGTDLVLHILTVLSVIVTTFKPLGRIYTIAKIALS
jgi:hypothetical protein